MQAVIGRIAIELGRKLFGESAQRVSLGVCGFAIECRIDPAGQGAVVGDRASKPHLWRKQQPDRTGTGAFILLFEQAALRAPEDIVAARMKIDRGALVLPELNPGEVAAAAGKSMARRSICRDLRNTFLETILKDDVHDLLVGRITIFERDLLGQDVDPRDRLDRDIAQLAIARDPPTVEKHQWAGGARRPRDPDLRRDRDEEFVEARRARGFDVARTKDVFRLDIADDRTAGALTSDDDLFLLLRILARLLSVSALGRRRCRLSLQRRKGRRHGGPQEHRDAGAVQHAPPVEERA